MEKLSICSKILYDKDIIEKMKEIQQLKKHSRYYMPDIVFSCVSESKEKRKEVYNDVKKCLQTYRGWDQIVSGDGLRPQFMYDISRVIDNHLSSLTNDPHWSGYTSWDIIMNIETFCKGFVYNDIPFVYEPDQLVDMLYEQIKYKLDYKVFTACTYFKCPCGDLTRAYDYWSDETQISCKKCREYNK